MVELNILSLLGISILIGVVFLSVIFMIASLKNRYDLVDSVWGMAFWVILTGHVFLVASEGAINTATWIVYAMVTIWAFRLSFHVYSRFLKSAEQDPRYTEMIEDWKGPIAVQAYLRIYLLQAFLASIIVLPAVIIIHSADAIPNSYLTFGALIWLFGFMFESVADKQLQKFVNNSANKGKLMMTGLWRYSRHPNYFGELIQWWGIGTIALSAPQGYFGLIGPLILSLLIVFISGIPPAERRSAKKPNWNGYRQRTSVLIPWINSKD